MSKFLILAFSAGVILTSTEVYAQSYGSDQCGSMYAYMKGANGRPFFLWQYRVVHWPADRNSEVVTPRPGTLCARGWKEDL